MGISFRGSFQALAFCFLEENTVAKCFFSILALCGCNPDNIKRRAVCFAARLVVLRLLLMIIAHSEEVPAFRAIAAVYMD